MTVTELNDALAQLINTAELPFDAKVFVVRSIHAEMEQKYTAVKQVLRAQQEAQKAKDLEVQKTDGSKKK